MIWLEILIYVSFVSINSSSVWLWNKGSPKYLLVGEYICLSQGYFVNKKYNTLLLPLSLLIVENKVVPRPRAMSWGVSISDFHLKKNSSFWNLDEKAFEI